MSNVRKIVLEMEDGTKLELNSAQILQVEQKWEGREDPNALTKVTFRFKGQPYIAPGPVGDWAYTWDDTKP